MSAVLSNVLPLRTERDGVSARAAIEDFPWVLAKIELMWNTRELDAFLSQLILDSRDGTRRGFPVSVAGELMFLAETNRLTRALGTVEQLGIDLAEAYRLITEGDEAGIRKDVLDDPAVSHDTTSRQERERPRKAVQRNAAETERPMSLLEQAILNKWLLIAIAGIVAAKLLIG
ncbi:MAG TPA: hypothetical protein VF816_05785 [Rhodocyclaceae bacterium]